MLIALVSGKGSPGTSTSALALALAWPRPVLLVDGDPRGGDLLWGYGRGSYAQGAGLLAFQVNSRRSTTLTDALWPAAVELGENRWALPGIDESRQSGSVDWAGLAAALRGVPEDMDVVADCGVVPAHRPPTQIWTAADLVVVMTRSSLKSTRAALNAATMTRTDLMASGLGADRLVSALVGPGRPYSAAEVGQAMAPTAPLVGELPWEPQGAHTLSDGAVTGKRRLARLTSAAAGLAGELRDRAAALVAATPPSERSGPPRAVIPAPPSPGTLFGHPVASSNGHASGAAAS